MKKSFSGSRALSLLAMVLPFVALACAGHGEDVGSDEADFRTGKCKSCSCTPAPTTPTTPPLTPTPSTPPTGFHVGQRPFLASSSWNTAVGAGASYRKLSWPAPTGYNYRVSWDGYTPAIYSGTSADPLVAVATPASWGWPADTIKVHLPAGVSGANGTDGEILILEGTTIHNCWQFQRTSDTTATCAAYGRADALTDTGWGSKSPFLSAGIVATGSSQYAGLLVQAETDAGEIEHALQLVLDGVLQKPDPVGEAISSDGSSASGIAQEGERLAIPRSVTMPAGLSPLGQKAFRALQKYGAFDVDVAGGCSTIRAQANAYDDATITALNTDMSTLIPLLASLRP